jgi:hypothetical protein
MDFQKVPELCSVAFSFRDNSHLALCFYCPVTLYVALLVIDCNLDIVLCLMPVSAVGFHLPCTCQPWQGCISSAHRADGVTDSGRMGVMIS